MPTGPVSRRSFIQAAVLGAASTAMGAFPAAGQNAPELILGGPLPGKPSSPESWIGALRELGYRAAFCPLEPQSDDKTVRSYEEAARKAGIVIAEVGAWSNPLSPDDTERAKALETCRLGLDLADRIGARCCVNISGSRGKVWDGPDPANLTRSTFEMIVDSCRSIIDAVHPARTFFTLETMPWMYPDSPDSYLDLIKAVDRKAFAAHLDPVNLVCSPQRYFGNGDLIRECFDKLGPWIKSCHAKDIQLRNSLTTHLDEVAAGEGGLDWPAYLTELKKMPDVPLMLEHLKTPAEFARAAAYVRDLARKVGFEVD